MSFVYIFIRGEKHSILGKKFQHFYNLVVKKEDQQTVVIL